MIAAAPASSLSYFDFEEHRDWQSHHVIGNYRGGCFLAFSEDFLLRAMPPDMSGSGHKQELAITLYDKEYGQRFDAWHVVSYGDDGEVLGKDWESVQVSSLQPYFYESHYCPCHRGGDIRRVGPPEDWEWDGKCEDGRFFIEQIVWDQRPDLILYSETHPELELEKRLRKGTTK